MRNKYILYLNGRHYGMGDMRYMLELITDYVGACDMYGRNSVDFKIEKCEKKIKECLNAEEDSRVF